MQPTRWTRLIFVVTLPCAGARSVQVALARREPGGAHAGPYQLLMAAKLSLPGLIPSAPRLKSSSSPRFERSSLADTEPLPRIERLPTTETPTPIRPCLIFPAGQRKRRPIEWEAKLRQRKRSGFCDSKLGWSRSWVSCGSGRLTEIRACSWVSFWPTLTRTRSSGPGVSLGSRAISAFAIAGPARISTNASVPAHIDVFLISPFPRESVSRRRAERARPSAARPPVHPGSPASTSSLSPVCASAAPPRSRR